MPTTRELHHCKAVLVFGPADPPMDVVIDMSVGGSAGDGHVDVKRTENGAPVGSVPTGTSLAPPIEVLSAVEIWLHYVAGPGKPQTVDVECVFHIS